MNAKLFSILLIFMLSGEALSQTYLCQGLWQGEIVPNPNDCTKFYVCILYVPWSIECPENKVFNENSLQCEPGDPFTCEIFGVTTPEPITSTTSEPPTSTITVTLTNPTTTSAGVTPTPPIDPVDLDEICRGVFFSALPYPNSLSLYVGCIRERGVLFQCFEDEFFHPVLNECLILPTVPTEEPSTTTEATTTTTERIISTTNAPNLSGICEGLSSVYIPHPTACGLYIFCLDGLYSVRQCPQFNIWNDVDKECQPGNQETCELTVENTLPITEPTPEVTSPEVTTPEVTTPEVTTPEVTTPEVTSPEVTTPEVTTPEVTTPEVTTPEVTTPEVTTPEVTTPEVTTPIVINNPCEGILSGNIPNPDDCTRYYGCFSGTPVPRQCREGQVFNSQRMLCVNGNTETCVPYS